MKITFSPSLEVKSAKVGDLFTDSNGVLYVLGSFNHPDVATRDRRNSYFMQSIGITLSVVSFFSTIDDATSGFEPLSERVIIDP